VYKWLDVSKAKSKQSTTAHGGAAGRAIDGSAATKWSQRSCTHTNSEKNPWWEVDMGSIQNIKSIAITNRGDCCEGRLSGFTVSVDGTECATKVSLGKGETKQVMCNAVGKTLRVGKSNSKAQAFTICEVKVAAAALATTQAPTPAPTQAPTAAPVPPTPAFTPAPPSATTPAPATGTTLAALGKTPQSTGAGVANIFDRVDLDNSKGIDRVEFKKALDAGKFTEKTAATKPVPGPAPSPPSKAPASSPSLSRSQMDAIVKKHNDLRAAMGASDMMEMKWDDTLAAAAQKWVSGLSLADVSVSQGASKCPSGHSQNRNGAGENMAWKWSSSVTSISPSTDYTPSVQSWYDEIKDAGPYKDGGTFGGFDQCTGVCGHYTQVVWAAADKIGCAAEFCPHSTGMGGYELVCQYGSSVPGAHGGNMGGSTLFTKGAACSTCPSGFNKCSNNLCSPGR
jgi:uncharacterized protein YkwD